MTDGRTRLIPIYYCHLLCEGHNQDVYIEIRHCRKEGLKKQVNLTAISISQNFHWQTLVISRTEMQIKFQRLGGIN